MPVLDVQVLSHGASLVLLPESATVRITAVDADGPRKRLEGSDLVFARTSVIEVRNGKPVREIDLIPTDGTFCYQVAVTTTVGAFKFGRYITVPDVPGPVRLGDRPDVDPATFQPTADVIAAWREVTAEVIAARDGSYAARTAAEAAAATASTAATAAGTAKTSAAASAAAAGVAADGAGHAATAAGQAATGAGLAAGAAEGFARGADASATSALQSKITAGTSAEAAGASATEAAGSATTATPHAAGAAGSATTASQAATTATDAATDAAGSKTGAQTSAATADARAKDAATSATAAAGSATTADQRATAAGQSATAAASSATAAESSKTAAVTARTGAETAQTGAQAARTGAESAKTAAETARDVAQAASFPTTTPSSGTSLGTLTTRGLYLITYGATVAQGAPYEGFVGTVQVLPRASNAVTQIAWKHNALSNDSRRFYTRTQTGAGWGAWSTFVSAQFDQTAGRKLSFWDETNNRFQLVYGDTGVRDITALVTWPTGVSLTSGSKVLLRRTLFTVQVWIEEGLEAAGAVAQAQFVTLPAGFVPSVQGENSPVFSRNGLSLIGSVSTLIDGQVRVAFSAATGSGANTRMRHTFQTVQAWPTTLPGTVVGSIPNT